MSTELAQNLVERFRHMVERDGGELFVAEVDASVITLGYRAGTDPNCEDGACVLPHVEIETLVQETVRRTNPDLTVKVEPQ